MEAGDDLVGSGPILLAKEFASSSHVGSEDRKGSFGPAEVRNKDIHVMHEDKIPEELYPQ